MPPKSSPVRAFRPLFQGAQHLIHFINVPDSPLVLDPSATVFHYAQGLFEGLKAYRDANGKITLFRPDMNMRRMNSSAARIALPVRVGITHMRCRCLTLVAYPSFRLSTATLSLTSSRSSSGLTQNGFPTRRGTAYIFVPP